MPKYSPWEDPEIFSPRNKGEKKLADFRKKEIPKPDKPKTGHIELFEKLDIEAQYNARFETLKSAGIIERLPKCKEYGIIGIDGQEYPIPSIDQIKSKIFENEEMLAKKHEQGFVKLIITPIAMSFNKLAQKHGEQILRHHKAGTLKATNGDTLELNESEPIYLSDSNKNDPDISGDLVYYPERYEKENSGGKTKAELLQENQTGWEIKLIEDLPDIPAENNGQTIENRKQLEANKKPKEYLESIQNDPQYENEQGLTPEDRLIYAMSELEENNQIIDDWQGNGKICYCLGAYFKSSGRVPCGSWHRDGSQADLGASDPGDVSSNFGARSGVSVF